MGNTCQQDVGADAHIRPRDDVGIVPYELKSYRLCAIIPPDVGNDLCVVPPKMRKVLRNGTQAVPYEEDTL